MATRSTHTYPPKGLQTIGYLKRLHATQGALVLQWHELTPSGQPTELLEIFPDDFLFLSIENLPVPFRVKSYTEFPNGTCSLTLHNVTTQEQAEQLVGCSVQMEIEREKQDGTTSESEDTPPYEIEEFIGFTLRNEMGNTVGTIVSVEQYSLNRLLVVKDEAGRSLLIPYHLELVVQLPSEHKRELIMRIPPELLDL